MIFFYNYLFITVFWVLLTVYLLINSYRIKFLKAVKTSEKKSEPSVAVIIAVRNEEADLESALNNLCRLDYSNYRLILVNDRSTDGTAVILEAFARRFQHVKVFHIDELPAGWIGKSHALYKGYQNTTEEWLLFTDADVLFKPDTLKKAVHYITSQQLDHLVVLPHIHSRSTILNSVLATFKIMFDLQYRPWAAKNMQSNASIGIGAFNFVRRSAYEACGSHRRFSIHPNDDLQLGSCIKSSGFKQDVLYGDDQVQYEWYPSLNDFINGLMKNAFSSVNYNLSKAVFNAIAAILFFVLPVPFLLLSSVPAQQIMGVAILISQLSLFALKRASNAMWWYIFTIPFAAAVISYILLRSSIMTLMQGGIYWRENFYSLSDLKKCR